MPDEKVDFIAKLHEIEEQANRAHGELPRGLTRNRLQHIAIVAKYLRSRLDLVAPSGLDASPAAEKKPPP